MGTQVGRNYWAVPHGLFDELDAGKQSMAVNRTF